MRWWRGSSIRRRADSSIRARRRRRTRTKAALGILGTRRKPFQDSPTPAGNSAAAIALLRLHGYADDDRMATRRIATRPSRRWRSMPGSRASTAFLRRLTGWRWSASSSRTRKWWSSGRMTAAAELYRAAVRAAGLEHGGSAFGRGQGCRAEPATGFGGDDPESSGAGRQDDRLRWCARGSPASRRFSMRRNWRGRWGRGRVRRLELGGWIWGTSGADPIFHCDRATGLKFRLSAPISITV